MTSDECRMTAARLRDSKFLSRSIQPSFQSRSKGFTLVELIVVLLIVSVISVVLFTVFAGSIRTLRSGETRTQLVTNARTALRILSDSIESSTLIPRNVDRNTNGIIDDKETQFVGGDGPSWVLGDPIDINGNQRIFSYYIISEAYSDRLMVAHSSKAPTSFGQSLLAAFRTPKPPIHSYGGKQVSEDQMLFLLATSSAPYYQRSEPTQRVDLPGYPHSITIGNRNETNVLFENVNLTFVDGTTSRLERLPIASNITRIHFEYLHEVPVYMRDASGQIERDRNQNPILLGKSLVPVDIVDTRSILFPIRTMYPAPGDVFTNQDYYNWGMQIWNGIDSTPLYAIDYKAYTATSPAMNDIQLSTVYGGAGFFYQNPPLQNNIYGEADGIPDGDGIPDDPVPGYWLPYIKAIKISVVATPRTIADARMRGRVDSSTSPPQQLYYTPDNPVPFSDYSRTRPIYGRRDLQIGPGMDVVMVNTVYPRLNYRLNLITDPSDSRWIGTSADGDRRVDFNYRNGLSATINRPVSIGEKNVTTDVKASRITYDTFGP